MGATVNTEQAAAWNGYEGQHWADHADRYDAVNGGFNAALLAAADVGSRDRILDVGCGTGQVTRLAARRATEGRALGLDLSAPMLERARLRAGTEQVSNVDFESGDAQVHPLTPGGFDVVVSRFGNMFFADPVAAFTNLARALRPGGRLAMLTMRPIADHDLAGVFAAFGAHLPPDGAGESDAGPLSFADPAVVRTVLERAGFAGIDVTAVDAMQLWGSDAADAGGFLGAWGPIRHRLSPLDDETAARARAALVSALEPFAGPDGVRLRGAAWLVTAVRP